ncbi:hypothetical protein D7X30_37670 [Corallococcus sp. AB011P]|nr:hypothetical protein D7X30_37670 [Corallococcus sp. AB011P]RKH79585.1 hypothetical protein D7Y21_33550 [Corallococcus sp. AB045]
MAAFKKDSFDSKVAELKEAAGGADLQVTLDEASFTTVAAIQMLSNGVFDRLIDDMKSVCIDDIGKQAVREGIQTLHIVHRDAPGFTLELTGGTFTVRAKVDGSLGEDLPGYGTYRAFLLKKL